MVSTFKFLLVVFCLSFSGTSAQADFAKDIGHISRDPGGDTVVIKFPSPEPGDSVVSFTVRDYGIRFHSVYINFDNDVSLQYVDWIDPDERDRRFIHADQTVNFRPKSKAKIIGLTIQLESYEGPGILKIAVKSGQSTTPPTAPVNPPAKPTEPPTKPTVPTPPPPSIGEIPSLECRADSSNGRGAQPVVEGTNQKLGNGAFQAATDCEVAIGQQEKNILCAINSNGDVQAMRASDRRFLGEYAYLDATSCFRSIVNATKTAICLQGQNRNEFALFGIKTGKWIDGTFVSRDQCFAAADKTRESNAGSPSKPTVPPAPTVPAPPAVDAGNNLEQCLKFATEKYAIDFSATSAAEKARVACKKIETLIVTKFLFEAFAKDYSAGISMDRASDMADGTLKGKLAIVKFAYLNYLTEFSSGVAASKAGDKTSLVSVDALSCLQNSFEKNKRENGPANSMDRAFNECR